MESVNPEVFGNGRIQNIKWAFDYSKKTKATKEAISDIPGIICHADMNVTNMLWKKDSPNNEIGAIIDYQMLFIGSIAFDIIRILTLGMTREVRREKTESYLEYYHKTLAEFFDGQAPFSMEEVSEFYLSINPEIILASPPIQLDIPVCFQLHTVRNRVVYQDVFRWNTWKH